MEPIKIQGNPHLNKDRSGKPRWSIVTEDGTHMLQARWMMSNFLHTKSIPKVFHVHHINERTDDDRIENFQIKRNGAHTSEHRKYTGRFGISRQDDPRKYDSLLAIERNADPVKREKYLSRKKELHEIHAEEERIYRINYRKEHLDECLAKEALHRKKLSKDPIFQEKNRLNAKKQREKVKQDPEAMEQKRLYQKLYMRKRRAKKREEKLNEISQLS